MTLWEEYHEQVPEGYGYTQFCEHLNRYLQVKQAVMHFEHEPAASLMFDYAGSKIPFTDLQTGEVIYCPVLVCTLPFSDYTYLDASLSAKRTQILHILNQSFNYFGGVPYSAKTDNMKQVVKKSDRYEPSFEELAQQWSLHYGTTLMAARIKIPRDKASAESHVNAITTVTGIPPWKNICRHITGTTPGVKTGTVSILLKKPPRSAHIHPLPSPGYSIRRSSSNKPITLAWAYSAWVRNTARSGWRQPAGVPWRVTR